MISIEINQETKTVESMTDVLERIVELLREGYTSGYHPAWSISGEEEPVTDEERECLKCGESIKISETRCSVSCIGAHCDNCETCNHD